MEIAFDKYRRNSGGRGSIAVDVLIEDSISSDRDGALEQARAETSNLAEVVGRLVDKLAEKGLLNVDEVLSIAGQSWRYENAEFKR